MTAVAERGRHPGVSAVVGMIGGGQLARMTHQAGIGLGVDLVVLSPRADDPAVRAGARHMTGDPHDPSALAALAEHCDVITLDHELVSTDALRQITTRHRVHPGPGALAMAQDKALARRTLAGAGFPVPAHTVVDAGDAVGVAAFADEHGWPVVVKWPTGGYDGRGVNIIRQLTDLASLSSGPGRPDGRWLLEEMVPIATELAVLVARRPSGDAVVYPVVETTQDDGICRELVMPADIPVEIERRAVAMARSIADGIDAIGILAVELFVTVDGRLVVNELAVRPHNSGHATLDASHTSQFENHLRAILDWPLGDTTMRAPAAAMVNILGTGSALDLERVPQALEDTGVHLHLYGKSWRPGRKLGHVTALAATRAQALDAAHRAAAALEGR